MAMASFNLPLAPHNKTQGRFQISCRRKEKERNNFDPYKVIEITPPPKNLGIRCFPPGVARFRLFLRQWEKKWVIGS
ncbi:uncharacterized protein E5676_scaffold249G00010 [Cucumis melo var. makuwa]|uniref:Uncharacterized protein n=1 Tax=Cucumis melo var. makuwa TaxID=1194695 RepID=A0A5D3CDH4_CUCMM|nr:uncharacterized protein E6C27_scaffold277G002310 [Cucumis melo var. makuwa]TYK09322.1 uncharacterized protein E5676_scaffold249G00010 [Cucumis melo var. makuwa]